MRSKLLFIYVFSILLAIGGCNNLEQDTKVSLPNHESKLVVECYLEAGKKAKLLLTNSSGYFDSPELPFVNNATVTLTYNGIIDTFKINNVDENDVKIYNYVSKRVVPEDYNEEFLLNIVDPVGRVVFGKTKLIRATHIDSVIYKYKDSLAYVLASFHQDLKTEDY
jgi:hypothetical protein